jgi:hypothetical protein
MGKTIFNRRSAGMRTHRKTEDTLKKMWTGIEICKTNGKMGTVVAGWAKSTYNY